MCKYRLESGLSQKTATPQTTNKKIQTDKHNHNKTPPPKQTKTQNTALPVWGLCFLLYLTRKVRCLSKQTRLQKLSLWLSALHLTCEEIGVHLQLTQWLELHKQWIAKFRAATPFFTLEHNNCQLLKENLY